MLVGAERIECKVQMMANNTDYYYSCIIIRKLIFFRYIYDTVQGGGGIFANYNLEKQTLQLLAQKKFPLSLMCI